MPKVVPRRLSFLFIMILLLPSIAPGYPSNSWKHMKGGNFTVSYNEKTEHLAEKALYIAQEIQETLGRYFGNEIKLPKVAIVLKDHNDYSNGSASRYIPLVTVECRKTEFTWRGETRWLRNVLSHELSHIYSLRIMQFPLIYTVQTSLSSESNNIEGYGGLVYRHNRLPKWFVEGLAQLGSNEFKADFRDPFREMLLRDAFLNNRLLSLDAMSRFEGTARESELAYNQGFDFILFLKNTYLEKNIHELCKHVMSQGFEKAVQEYYGISIKEIYNGWLNTLEKRYQEKKLGKLPGHPIYPQRKKAFNMEMRSAGMGRYVITNWRHDSRRFDLMIMSENGEKVKKVVKDVGMMLKEDFSDNTVWFNKLVYNYETGVANYDVFHIDREGKENRITTGKRCIALDARDGYLMYGAYKNGTTDIVLRSPDGSEHTLKTFSFDTSIYNISMLSHDTALLSMGMGSKVTLGMLRKDRLDILFQGIDADINDVVFAGENRILFMSTIDGFPQLYWCNLNNRNQWYRLTDVAGGVRYPAVEGQADNQHISCTVYKNGHFIRYRLNKTFSKDIPVDMAFELSGVSGSADGASEKKTGALLLPASSNIISRTPYLRLIISSENQLASSPGETPADTIIITTGSSFLIQNAPGNLKLGFDGNLKYPVGFNTTSTFHPTGGPWCEFHIRQVRLLTEVSLNTYLSELKGDVPDDYGNPVTCDILKKSDVVFINTRAEYQVAKDDLFYVSYAHLTENYEYTLKPRDSSYRSVFEDYGTIISGSINSLAWVHETTQSRFDPGRLGVPYYSVNAGMDYRNFSYPGYNYYNDATGIKISFEIQKRFLLIDSRISIKLNVDGFSYADDGENSELPPYMYSYIGRESLFSGYPIIGVGKMVRGYSELRLNPLISPFDRTHWYERMNIGFKVEAGSIDYIYESENESQINSATPCSFETTFRYYTYFWPNQESRAYIKYAVPINKVDGIGDDEPYRIYFGLEL